MKNYVSPNETLKNTDSASIAAAIEKAKRDGCNTVVIPSLNERTGENLWVIDETVLLPSDIEIVIDNAHLVLADGTYINMFRNENAGTQIGKNAEGEQKNITIRGIGNAVLDGGNYNGLSERNSEKDGRPHISRNTTLLFANVSGLTVENLSIINQRWWGATNIFVHHSAYRNIYFKADYSRIDENGVHHPNEFPKTYEEIYVKNADGIDLRVGCHDFVIENILGITEDDTVALTALGGFETKFGYIVDGLPGDIHDVKIKNVCSDPCFCACVRLLNDNGHKMYSIEIDGVSSVSLADKNIRPGHTVRIGDTAYAETESVLGDTCGISVKNVVSRGHCGVSICKGIKDSRIENITVYGGGELGFGIFRRAQAENCTLGNIVLAESGSRAYSLDGLEGGIKIL